MHSVRKRILEILKESSGATVAQLAGALEMAPVSVRHHLDILQGENLICVDRVKRRGSVGRPQQIYVLTAAACDYFPNNFAMLAEGLVCQLKSVLPPDQVRHAFRAMANQLADDMDMHEVAESTPEERLTHITDFLTEQGYLARWEEAEGEGEGVYLLHKHNCPYAGVSEEHDELCLMDQELVNQLIGQPCQRTNSLVADDRCCTYRIELQSSVPVSLELESADTLGSPDLHKNLSTLPAGN